VRAVAAGGRISSLPGRFDQPDGLALARNGDLYVATERSVVRIRANGRRTVFVTGHGRFDQISVGTRRYGAFDPSYLALDAAGDLYAFSFGTKTIFEFSPGGTPLDARQDYADGLAEAPDGSVVIAEHGTALQRVRHGRLTPIMDFRKSALVGYPRAGTFAGNFDPDGVAVAPDGTIYTDTFVGNGWTNQTALAEITAPGRGHLLATVSPLARTLPALGAHGFPAPLYPTPLPARAGADPAACPSPTGLRPFSARARTAAVETARRIDATPLWNELRRSDRAWWPGLYTDQINGMYEQGLHRVIAVGPAAHDAYAAAIVRACGRALLAESLAVTTGPGVYSDQVSHAYFLDRGGRALLYWQHT
jgi:sugar lactone lactonase YvrE